MGTQKYKKRIEELFEKSPVVDFASLRKIIGSDYAKLYVSSARKQGKIIRLAKGRYTIYRESSLTVFAFQPAYLGLQSALSHHGLWEQETIPVILTTKTIRIGIRQVMDGNVNIHRISKEHFFGFSPLQDGRFYLPYSDVEKTIIDMLWFRQAIETESIKKAKKAVNASKLKKYLESYPLPFRRKAWCLIS